MVRQFLTILVLSLFAPAALIAQDDIDGSSDHPDFPRIAGSTIIGYAYSSFDEAGYLEGVGEEFEQNFAAGEVTQLLYQIPLDISPAGALLNYKAAFDETGEFQEHYICRRGACDDKLSRNYIWSDGQRFDTIFSNANNSIFGSNFQNQNYLSGTITADTGVFTVSLYTVKTKRAKSSGDRELAANQTVVVLRIVKTEAFEADLEVVAADEISSEISTSGHVALYGLFFETDSDVLIDTSTPALEEVANFLRTSPDVKVYVVGHTDFVGDVGYNQDLSLRRANSIAQNLASDYGIDASRITPLGAGLAAPVSTNRTPEGRAQNRRVELVERE